MVDNKKDTCQIGETIELEQYRDKWLSEKLDEYIGFYTREFFALDNFSSFGIIMNGLFYPTVEHAYQAGKFINTAPEIAEQIRCCLSAHEAKRIAHVHISKQAENWDDIKVDYMEKLLRLKLEQNPYVKQKLLQTKGYRICEDSPKDNFWGIGENRDGQNQLGRLWMKLRGEISTEKEQQS